MLGRPLQPENALLPMLVRFAGSAMLVKPQPANAASLILVIPAGSLMLVRPLQPWNAATPMLVRVAGNVTLFRPRHS